MSVRTITVVNSFSYTTRFVSNHRNTMDSFSELLSSGETVSPMARTKRKVAQLRAHMYLACELTINKAHP